MAALIGRGLGSSVALPDARDAKASGEGSALYSLYFSPGGHHADDMWNVFGPGFGLRCFYTKAAAEDAATAYFGTARISLQLWPDRTSLHVQSAPGAAPADVLDQAISALQAERAALARCPAHKALPPQPRDQQVVGDRSRDEPKSEPDQ